MKTTAKIASLLFVILLSIGILLYNGIIWFVYPNNKYPKGIDISHHQGEINWQSLMKSDLSFVFMKATEGDDFVDKKFKDNWKSADSLKIKKGAYHFYSLRFSGKAQALNYINIVPNEKDILPPVIDLEYGGNSQKRPLKKDFQKELKVFIELIEKHYSKKPIFYVTYEFYEDYIYPDFNDYQIWIRDIFSKPNSKKVDNWLFWQYSNRGKIEGINGFVDLNVFCGDINQLLEL
jgi:lysozyme